MRRPRPEQPWVRMLPGNGDGHMHGVCLGCNERYVVGLPAPIDIAIKTTNLYLRRHLRCGKAWEAKGKPETVPPELLGPRLAWPGLKEGEPK